MSEIELVKRLRNATGAVSETALCAEAADAVEALVSALDGIGELLDQADDTPFGKIDKLLDKMAERCNTALRKVRP